MANTTGKQKKFYPTDLLAGFSVALIAIPQALAYAELAGMPAYTGLYAVAFASIAAAFFASSPYLQTGPIATTSLLTLGVLSQLAEPFSPNYIALAGLLALIVGVIRLIFGIFKMGRIAYLMSQPVLMGFMSAAALLIIASQLPTSLGVNTQSSSILYNLLITVSQPNQWQADAILLSVFTVSLMLLGKKIHPLFPSVLIIVVVGILYSIFLPYSSALVGSIPQGFPSLSLNLPWQALPNLVLGGAVIAIVGFAEAASISRTYATLDRSIWNANKEFISQGAANLASGLFGGFPVGGSFSRSSVNRLAGAKTRWSGLVTGLTVLAFLPFTFLLADLPKAILGAIIIAAVRNLVRLKELWNLKNYSKTQAYIAWISFALTIVLAPRIDLAILIGIAMAIAHHLRREQQVYIDIWIYGSVLHVKPKGVLWFGSSAVVEEKLNEALARHKDATKLDLHLGGLGRIDLSAALMLKRLMADAEKAGLEVELVSVPPMARSWVERVWADELE